MASNEAFKKQAEGASNAAKKFMEENDQLQQVRKPSGQNTGTPLMLNIQSVNRHTANHPASKRVHR